MNSEALLRLVRAQQPGRHRDALAPAGRQFVGTQLARIAPRRLQFGQIDLGTALQQQLELLGRAHHLAARQQQPALGVTDAECQRRPHTHEVLVDGERRKADGFGHGSGVCRLGCIAALRFFTLPPSLAAGFALGRPVLGALARPGLCAHHHDPAPTPICTMPQQSQERRHFARVAFEAPAQLSTTEARLNAQVSDLSLRGALLELPEPPVGLEAGEPCLLAVRLGEAVIKMGGEVAHVQGRQVGVQCGSIDLESITHLRRLVEMNLGGGSLLERELKALLAA